MKSHDLLVKSKICLLRYKNWKLIVGVRGDSKLYPEPKDGDWVGTTLTDYVAEMIMHFQHWANEDASGTLDESVRGEE